MLLGLLTLIPTIVDALHPRVLPRSGHIRTPCLQLSQTDEGSGEPFDYEADLRQTIKVRSALDAAQQQAAAAAQQELDTRYLERYRARGLDLEAIGDATPRGHGKWSANLPKGVQPVSASPYESPQAQPTQVESELFSRLDSIRADFFLLGLTATLGLTVLCTSGSASAEEGGALGLPMMLNGAAAADEPGDIFSWVAQNAALETAWLALIGVAIASVALGDPKR